MILGFFWNPRETCVLLDENNRLCLYLCMSDFRNTACGCHGQPSGVHLTVVIALPINAESEAGIIRGIPIVHDQRNYKLWYGQN